MLLRLSSVGLLLLATALPCPAVIGTADNVPAATLLIPYFVVDTADPFGVTTLVWVQNVSASPAIAHVVLWTDLGIPTLTFDLYLVGFRQVSFNLGDILRNGYLPGTGAAPVGFPVCLGVLPYVNPAVPPSLRADLVAAHTGQMSSSILGGSCGGVDHGDVIARGYLTVDVTLDCTLGRPGDSGYFDGAGAGIASNENLLAGLYLVADLSTGLMDAERAVAIEASETDPLTDGSGDYTFYGRLVGASGDDHREALPNAWAVPYLAGSQSGLRVWRDPGVVVAPFACAGGPPAPFPLAASEILPFDNAENPAPIGGTPLPWASVQAVVGTDLPVPAKQGWMHLNLNLPIAAGPFGRFRQSWLTAIWSSGQSAVNRPATQLGGAAGGDDPVLSTP